jgi:hypothetical protein
MSGKPRLLLLDAGAVFAALRFDAWEALVSAYEVVVPSVVVRVEAIFYVTREDQRIEIDLPAEVEQDRIREVVMSAAEIDAVRKRFTPDFRERLDDGELETLAYMLDNPDEDVRFVTGDGPAIQAVAMLDPDCRVISLAEVLDRCGYTKPLPDQFSRDFVKRHVGEGSLRRIQGRGLVGR